MKIGILCSHPFAFLSIDLLSSKGILAGLGGPVKDEFTPHLKNISNQLFLPLKIFEDNQETSFKEWLDMVMPDTVFVMGFPFKIPESVYSIPSLGFYNFHTGILPKYRGIDPVFWQIKNREPYGGISVHRMDVGFDTGSIVHIEKIEIPAEETYGSHLQRLAYTARECTAKMIDMLSSENITEQEQAEYRAVHLKRPEMKDLLIDWGHQTSGAIKALVQASNPVYGGATTFFNGMILRILQVSVKNETVHNDAQPGTIVNIENGLGVICRDQTVINIDILFSDAGMYTGERFTRFFQVNEGNRFTNVQFPE